MTNSAPTPPGPFCPGYLGRVALLAAALGVGAGIAGATGVAWAEPTESGSRTSTSADAHETSRPGGSAPSAAGQRTPSTPSPRPAASRSETPATGNPIPVIQRSALHVADRAASSLVATGGPAEGSVTLVAPVEQSSPVATVNDRAGAAVDIPVRPIDAAAATVAVPPIGPAAAVAPPALTSSPLTQSLAHSTSGLTGTVLGLDPAFFPVMGIWMDNFATSNGRTFRRVWYPNIPSRRNSELGVAALDKQLHETPGVKIVFGHSMGAQVAAKWLREKGPTSDIPASDLVFILGGNPERKYGGALLVPARPKLWGFWPIEPTYGGPGIPDDTPYTVIDYARQYDWWADAPTSPTPNRTAQQNASQGIHSNYFTVGIDDPDVLTYVEGNRIYKLKPTTIAASKRVVVEQSYSRPTG